MPFVIEKVVSMFYEIQKRCDSINDEEEEKVEPIKPENMS